MKGKAIALEYNTDEPGQTTTQPENLQEGEQEFTIPAGRSAVLIDVSVKHPDVHLFGTA